MKRIRSFILTTVLGGVAIILPMAIISMVFHWLFVKITTLIQPATNFIMEKSKTQELVADALVVAVILAICFFIGLLIKTALGKFLFQTIEKIGLNLIPGYKMVKETVLQFIGDKKSPFSSVALANIFGNETMVTAFVTDEHPDGSYTVFVPTGPNPTSGNIYHLKSDYVQKVNFPVEATMRSIISCGAGSRDLLSNLK